MFYYSLIGLACNYMFLQDLSLLINRKKNLVYPVILSKKFNGFGREEYLHLNEILPEHATRPTITTVDAIRCVAIFLVTRKKGWNDALWEIPISN